MIKLVVPGKVVGKQRARKGKSGKWYTPKETKDYEDSIKEYFIIANRKHKPFTGAVSLIITAYYPIPKNTSLKRRAMMLTGEIRPIVKPDFDNIEKIYADALSGGVAYKDDNQVVDSRFHKYYSDNPRTEIIIDKIY